jgi:hypothetical protein
MTILLDPRVYRAEQYRITQVGDIDPRASWLLPVAGTITWPRRLKASRAMLPGVPVPVDRSDLIALWGIAEKPAAEQDQWFGELFSMTVFHVDAWVDDQWMNASVGGVTSAGDAPPEAHCPTCKKVAAAAERVASHPGAKPMLSQIATAMGPAIALRTLQDWRTKHRAKFNGLDLPLP